MDRNQDYGGFNQYQPYDLNYDPNMEEMPFNPMMQYEQGYIYYRYLCKQMEYKIKCKEYEKLSGTKTESRSERRVE